ncbi:MAG: hypothetical protein A2Z20_05435 [Bdellovibrionales bacterium RBG_16_40_8]|nr:MAG: hypothetical protein A2Z20_05435 [Bdellovibrionales bacterium RBG_16_40_8]
MSQFFCRIVFILFFLPSISFALVDMRNANYSDTWVDLQIKSSGYDMQIRRSYNSRTLYNGMLGFGWCSEFETSLKITPENTLRVTECGAGFEIEYLPANYNRKNLDKNIQAIVAEVRKRNKNRDEAYFKSIENDIRTDSTLRDEFAKQLNISGSISENSRYTADGRANDFIIYKNNEYVRNLPNGTVQKFNKIGRLTQMSDKNGNFIKLVHSGERLTAVSDNTGSSLQFKYYDNSKYVKHIVGPSGYSASYKYNGENLTEVTNSWKNTYKYEYDDLYNLTKAIYPDKTYIALTYDKDKDWVTSFRDRKGCKETYGYVDSDKDPLNNYRSSVEKVCDGKITNKSAYEFWHKTKNDGTRYLARSSATNNGRTVETTYHEEFGRPTEIIQDGIISRFDYYSDGLLKRKSDPVNTFVYNYENSCNKVSSVALTIINQNSALDRSISKNRKPTKAESKTITTEFKYDPKRCNLLAAINSTGQTASLSYDMRGRITKIIDQSKKIVTITYEERFGKPHVITRPGLGSITFKYKPDGRMDKFDSADDPLVAIQVVNIFSNLLEIIAPATTDTSI